LQIIATNDSNKRKVQNEVKKKADSVDIKSMKGGMYL